jgi:predicted CopG family antitoxin
VGRYLGKVMVAGPNPAEGSNLQFFSESKKCIYMHMHIALSMTKVISLSKEAYETLKGMKKPGESFSDVVLRVAQPKKKKSLLEFSGKWHGNDIDEVFAQIEKDRERMPSRKVDLFP